MTTVSKIEVKNVFKIFGARSKDALAMVGQGKTKDQVLAETGCVVGVNDLSLSIGTGEIFVIMGLAGSGKSSLLRCINGLNTVSRGQLFVEHEGRQIDIASCTPAELKMMRTKRIAMVFQKFALMPWLTRSEEHTSELQSQSTNSYAVFCLKKKNKKKKKKILI